MPYTVPTVADFRAKFPELADRGDEEIIPQLLEAALWVTPDPSIWLETDYQPALLLLAAHLLVLSDAAAAAQALPGGGGAAGGVQTYVQRVSIGDRHVNYGKVDVGGAGQGSGGNSIGEDFLLRSIYGERYLMIRSRNIIPVALV